MSGMTIGELSRRTGVSTDLLRAWERRYGLFVPERTLGGYRLYSALDEQRARRVSALRAEGMSAASAVETALAEYGRPGASEPTSDADHLVLTLERSVEAFDELAASAVIDQALTDLGLLEAIRQVVLPYLVRLGMRWQQGTASVAHEHFASHLIRRRFGALAIQHPRAGRSCAVIACPPGEFHDIGPLLVGVLLSHRGWSVRFLGADTPLIDLATVATALDPEVVLLSATRPSAFDARSSEIRALARRRRVAIGGKGAGPALAREVGAILLPLDLAEAINALDGLTKTA